MTRLGQMIWEDGIAEGKISAYIEMIRDGFITEEEAASRLNMTLEDIKIFLKDNISD